MTAARPRGAAQRLRAGAQALVVWALALWLAAAAHAQTESEPTPPGQPGAGNVRLDLYAPGDHAWQYKWVLSHAGMLETSWRPPTDDGGSPVTGYRVYWYQTADHAGTVQSVDVAPSGSGAQVYYVTGLTNGVEYGVGVTAINAVGEGPFRNGSGAALDSLPWVSPRDDPMINVPNARHDMEVRDLAAARSGANAVRVTWSKPSGPWILDYYTVSWAEEGRAEIAGSKRYYGSKVTSHQITGLTGGQRYRIEVETSYRFDGGAEGGPVATQVTFATAYGAPAAPGELEVLGHDRSLAVSWAASATDGGSPVTGYRLSWSGAGASGSTDLPATARAHTIPNLSNDSPYTVTLAASNAYYEGPAASGGDTPFADSAPSFGDATVAAQVRVANVPGAPDLTLPAASGGNFGLTYDLTPKIRGLTFDAATRVLSGTASQEGEHRMTYRADDGDRFTAVADAAVLTFTLTVKPNTAPTAAPIARTAIENMPMAFAASDFTGAFADADAGDSLQGVQIVPLPQSSTGRLTLGGAAVTTGQFIVPDDLDTLVFTPAADWSGTTTFGFMLLDQPGGFSDRATATITVHANDPPLPAVSTAPYGRGASGRTVTLTNSSRDPDGDTMTWQWEQTAGTAVTLSDATAESPTFTAPDSAGELTFRLTATDEHGASATGTVSLDVYAPPGAPATLTAQIGDGEVTLIWTPGAKNGDIIARWQYRVSADGGATWGPWQRAGRGSLHYFAVVTGLRNGTAYTLGVRAGNGAGYGATRAVTATPLANPESNRYAPRARAGVNGSLYGRTVAPGSTVALDASESDDWDYMIRTYIGADNVPVQEYDEEQEAKDFTYRWTQVRTNLATPLVTLDDATAMQPTFTAPDAPTTLVFRLTVSDGVFTDDAEVEVYVVLPEGTPSFGAITRRVSLGLRPGDTLSRVLPEATGGTAPLTYRLTPAAPGVMAFDAATREVTLTPTAVGSWTFDYTVTDDDGDSDTIPLSVRVAEVSTPPTFGGVSMSDIRLVKGELAVRDLRWRPYTLPRAGGGDGPLTYSLEPEVPGLTFYPLERVIRGRPTTAGSYAMTYKAVDSDAHHGDGDSATLSFTIDVVENSPVVALFPGRTVSLRMKVPMAKWRHTQRDLHRYPYAVNFKDYFYDPDGRDDFWLEKPAHPPIVFSFCPDDVRSCGYVDREGTWTIDVTAADSGGTATQRFHVTGLPPNRAPVARAMPGPDDEYWYRTDIRRGRTIGTYGDTVHLHHVVSGYFSDPETDPLTYRAVTSDPRLYVEIRTVRNNYLPGHGGVYPTAATLKGDPRPNGGTWTATVTVSATDPEGESAYIDIPVTVRNERNAGPIPVPPPPGAPSFGDAAVADRSWPANKAIVPLVLPEAAGGTAPLSYTLAPAVPGLTFDADTRTLSGTPTRVAAARSMTYQVSDSAAPARTASLSFSIAITDTAVGENAPTSAPFVTDLREDAAHTFAAGQIPFDDADADEYLHKLQVSTLPGHGTLRLNGVEQAAGAEIARADLSALTYHPPADWHGRTSFLFKVVDTTGRASVEYRAYLVVAPVNDAPTSADFERTVAEDTALTLKAADFAFADIDGHPDTLGAVVIASLPAATAGTLTLDGTAVTAGQSIPALNDADGKLSLGGLQFTPAVDWNGDATVHFGVVDSPGLASLDTYTATIRVTPVNDAPATADLGRTMDEDTTLTLALADFTFDDVDEGDRLKAIVFTQAPRFGTPPQPAGTLTSFHGSVEKAIAGGDTVAAAGLTRLVYRPGPDFSGTVTFAFQVADRAGAVSEPASGIVRVAPVNDRPTSETFGIEGDEDEEVTLAATDFAFHDPDADDRLKEVLVLTVPPATQGVLAVNGTPVQADEAVGRTDLDGLTFTPAPDWRGTAQFTFRVVDLAGARSSAAYAANFRIFDKNDAPAARDLVRRWRPSMNFQALFESVFSDPDADDRLKEIKLEETPSGGLLRSPLSDTPQLRGAVIAAVDLQYVTFEPLPDTYRGSVTYRVYDQSGEGSPKAYLLSLWRNSPPAASPLDRSTREDTPLPLTPADFEGVFTDAEHPADRLHEVMIAVPPARAQGRLTLDGVAVGARRVIARDRLVGMVFTPAPDWNGEAQFVFRVRDREGAQSEAATATVTVTAVADAPAAGVLALSIPEDTVLAFTAADFERVFSDPDPGDGLQAVRVVSVPDAKHGELALDGTALEAGRTIAHKDLGSLTFKPVAGWNGTATFDFTVMDQTDAESKPTTARVTVTAEEDAPVAGALNLTTPENTVLAFTAQDFKGVFSDTDPNDRLKAVKVVSLPDADHGALTLDDAKDDGGEDGGEKDDGDERKPPGARPGDRHGAPAGPRVTVGHVIALGDLGTLRFTPAKDWNGDASFTFRVVDMTDIESADAEATITVTGVGDAPAAGALHLSTPEDETLTFTVRDFDETFADPDRGDSLTAVRVVSLPAAAHGALALNGTALSANRKIERADLDGLAFTPVADWNGDASFTFRVVDRSHTESEAAVATVTVTAVPDAPAAADLNKSTAEDETLTYTEADFAGVFSDADEGDSLKAVQVVRLPDAAHGALALHAPAGDERKPGDGGSGGDDGGARSVRPVTVNQVIAHGDLGTLAFTPAADFAGEAAFEFRVVDQSDAASTAADASITVKAVPDAPAASDFNKSTAEDTALAFAASDFAGVFTDVDAGDRLTAVRVTSLPHTGHGALTLSGTAVTAGRKIAHGDLGTLTFTPAADWNGDASFTFQVVDRSDAESAAATATVTVTAVADAPAAGPLAVSTAEDTVLTFAAADFTGVFSDADGGDSLKSVKVTSLPDAGHGELALSGTAVTANQVIAQGDLGTLTFTPVADWNGAAAFEFTVTDQTDAESAAATATVTVTAVADAPAAGPLAVSTAEDTVLTFAAAGFTGVFSDADEGDSLKSVKVTSLPDAGHGELALSGTAVTADQVIAQDDLGTLTFTPAADWNGAAAFEFTVTDQTDKESAAAAATVTVTPVADAPAAGPTLGGEHGGGHGADLRGGRISTEAFIDADEGDSLKSVKVTSLPDAGHGKLALNGTAVTASQVIEHGGSWGRWRSRRQGTGTGMRRSGSR